MTQLPSPCCVCVGRVLWIRYLTPNPETLATLDEMRRDGVFHAALHWPLVRQRANRSEKAREGGLWHWMELSMVKWVRQLNLPLLLVRALSERGWMTPMDLALRSRHLDPTTVSLPLSFAGRGDFVFECHRAKHAIETEASLVLQMLFQRLVRLTRRAASFKTMKTAKVGCGVPTNPIHLSALTDIQSAISESTVHEQEVAACVLECLDALVDAVVAGVRFECREHDERIRWQEIPVRTEKWQATTQAVEALQQMMVRSVSCSPAASTRYES